MNYILNQIIGEDINMIFKKNSEYDPLIEGVTLQEMEWINVNKLPDVHSGVFFVKKKNGEVEKSYFYADGMAWRCLYGFPLVHWWQSKHPHAPIDQVTHWMKLIRNN